MPTRRQLRFDNLDQAIVDAEMLLANGYERAGNWSLSQVCDHLTDWITYPIDGFPKAPFPISLMLWMIRVTVGRKKMQSYLAARSLPAGKPTMPNTVHTASDESAAVAKFRNAVERFMKHSGPIYPSPIFGEMDKDVADQLQRVHTAHHLSFLVPKSKNQA